MKKAQGLPINVIIIIALVLIVLVVLIAIFASRTNIFTSKLSDCSTRGGICKAQCLEGEAQLSNLCDENQVCCVPIG